MAVPIHFLLLYCIPVWSGLSIENESAIERVQRSATKYILDFPDMRYKERLVKLNLLPLSYPRETADITFFFKCANNLYDINISDFVITLYVQEAPMTVTSFVYQFAK